MIDKLVSKVDINKVSLIKLDDNSIKIGELILTPILSPRTRDIFKHQTVIGNLIFTLKANEFTVSNSLHKFCRGNNYSDFYLSELRIVIDKIESLTGIKSENFIISKLEFGLNIETKEPPLSYLPQFSDFKGREFDKMRSLSFWYGIKYHLTDYAIKIYDKSEMIKRSERLNIEKNILRFEIQYHRSRKIPIAKTLKDLKSKYKIDIIFNDFIKQINLLNSNVTVGLSNISSRDREMYFAGQNQIFWNAEKEINYNTLKDKKKRFKSIQQKVIKKDLIINFIHDLNTKYHQLIQS